MVDLLWKADQKEKAIALERLWNILQKRTSFSLLCAYEINHLNKNAYEGALQQICSVHTDFVPVPDTDHYEGAIHVATEEILGLEMATMVKDLAVPETPATRMPGGQAMLLWLRDNMSVTFEKILARTRLHYLHFN
jgi:hypothetical protein